MKIDYKQERQLFFTALMFFTRIPCPKNIDHSNDLLNRSARYFPAVGWIVGVASAIAFVISAQLFPASIAVVISMVASIVITGAFHEDGFADCCDGFGGGFTKERVLTIMKDSRIGAFGAIGMILILLFKFLCLQAIATSFGTHWTIASLISAHAMSRFGAFLLMRYLDYVQDIDVSKIKPIATSKPNGNEILFAATFALLPMLLFPSFAVIFVIPFAAIGPATAGWYFHKRIGGYTGDCLGATQQITEIIVYLSVIALCR